MKITSFLSLVFLVFLNVMFSNAQETGFTCGHSEMQKKLFNENPNLKLEYDKLSEIARNRAFDNTKKRGVKYIIPVVFHILHENGVENISDDQVRDQMNILNRDYNKLNADTADVNPAFKDLIANCGFEFRLATKDPYGNCTNGIEHIYTHLTNNASDVSKINQWDRTKYLNVWVVKTIGQSGVAGYAYFPGSASLGFMGDGIIIKHEYIGSIGTSSENTSRALTHEIGHYFGLPHVWGPGNDPQIECGDDGVTDTPVSKGYTSCPTPSLQNKTIPNPEKGVPLQDQTCISNFIANYTLDSVTTNSGISDNSPLPDVQEVNLTKLKAVGVGLNSTKNAQFAFDNWGTGGINRDTTFTKQTGTIDFTKYYETKLNVAKNHLMNISKLTFKTSRDSNGVKSFVVRSSIDNFSSNLPITTSDKNITRIIKNQVYIKRDTTKPFVSTVTLDSKFFDLKDTQNVTFRIYGWNAEKSNGIFNIDSLFISGKTGAIENIENYMEYSYCSKMFTLGQEKLMKFYLDTTISHRNNLYTTKNLSETGTSDLTTVTCKPKAYFYASSNINKICTGSTLSFKDASWSSGATKRTWYFEDGTPSTSTDLNPKVTFNVKGFKKVSLVLENEAGKDSLVIPNYVVVQEDTTYFTGPLSANFENGKPWMWYTENDENNFASFQIVDKYGYNQSKCFKLNNFKDVSEAKIYEDDAYYYARLAGSKDAIISPAIDLSTTSTPTLSFDYAFATNAYYDSLVTDKINVYISKNCGRTWTQVYSITGSKGSGFSPSSKELLTAGNYNGKDFNPTANNYWKSINIDLDKSIGSSDIKTRVKIEFVASSYANNLFIDNIAINGVLQIKENPLNAMDLKIVPNPTTSRDGITVNYQANSEPITFELVDIQGKTLSKLENNNRNSFVSQQIGEGLNLATGCYYLNVKQGNYQTTKKVVIIE